MSTITWDQTGQRLYETGVSCGVIYHPDSTGKYLNGEAWNGLTKVAESPTGAESSPLYADDSVYLNLTSAEKFAATLEAYTYPESFAACDGTAEIVTGVTIGQQKRKSFGLAYRTRIGNDTDGDSHGYKLHLVYGATAAPSQRGYTTVNEKPEAITFSWELSTAPVAVAGHKPTASLTIDSTTCDATKLAALEAILYGSEDAEPRMPLPDEIKTLMTPAEDNTDDNP